MRLDRWVEFGPKMKERPKEFFWFEGTRILLRRLVNRRQRLMAMLVTETFITNKNLYSILSRDDALDIRVILAILNSKLISYLYLKQVSQATKDDFPQVTIRDTRALPFPLASRVSERSNQLVALVERMLVLHQKTEEEVEIVVIFGFYPAPILGLLDAAVKTLLEGLP